MGHSTNNMTSTTTLQIKIYFLSSELHLFVEQVTLKSEYNFYCNSLISYLDSLRIMFICQLFDSGEHTCTSQVGTIRQ